jgi:hypothetical protein
LAKDSVRNASLVSSSSGAGPAILLLAIAATVLCSCAAGSRDIRTAEAEAPAVSDLEVTPGSGSLTLSWKVKRGRDDVFGGFKVYILRESLAQGGQIETALRKARPVDDTPYPGDADGDILRESYEADGLENGVRYYCTVASLTAAGEISSWTREVMAICRPGGRATLQPIFSGDRDGFDFAAGRHVNTDDFECHAAFYVKAGVDHLISPSRIDPLLPETRFWDAGAQAGFDSLVDWQPAGAGVIELIPRQGHAYVYRTSDGNYGKFWIAQITREGDLHTIHFEFMYQPIPNLIHLR